MQKIRVGVLSTGNIAATMAKTLGCMEDVEMYAAASRCLEKAEAFAEEYGFEKVRDEQLELGARVRAMLLDKGIVSVAADGYGAPGVVVSYTDDPTIQNGSKFAAEGMQIAAGVPLMCDEPKDYKPFRLGLFGLDKLHDVDWAVTKLQKALDAVL